ncbi:MAG: HIRAN domain-containing protein [Gammaproteobacteria bacterium]|jgi:hypothetical protein|nr:HIRAN domain-containing protein [Gammaproteobacteria bacterium]
MVRSFLVGVRGESFLNDNGTSRQEIIRRLKKGARVRLVADPTNPHGRWAVKVFTERDEQIGWLPSDARDADAVLKDEPIAARIHAIHGGTNWLKRLLGKKHVGVVLRVEKSEPDWGRRQRLEATAHEYDDRIAKALEIEKNDEEAAIEAYRRVIAEVRDMTERDPYTSAHRRLPAPVNRLSLLLERRKLYKEAINVIEDWLNTFDPVQPTRSVSDTLRKRRDRLKRKLI